MASRYRGKSWKPEGSGSGQGRAADAPERRCELSCRRHRARLSETTHWGIRKSSPHSPPPSSLSYAPHPQHAPSADAMGKRPGIVRARTPPLATSCQRPQRSVRRCDRWTRTGAAIGRFAPCAAVRPCYVHQSRYPCPNDEGLLTPLDERFVPTLQESSSNLSKYASLRQDIPVYLLRCQNFKTGIRDALMRGQMENLRLPWTIA